MEVVRKMSKVPTDAHDRPRLPIKIVASAQLDDIEQFINNSTSVLKKVATPGYSIEAFT